MSNVSTLATSHRWSKQWFAEIHMTKSKTLCESLTKIGPLWQYTKDISSCNYANLCKYDCENI